MGADSLLPPGEDLQAFDSCCREGEGQFSLLGWSLQVDHTPGPTLLTRVAKEHKLNWIFWGGERVDLGGAEGGRVNAVHYTYNQLENTLYEFP